MYHRSFNPPPSDGCEHCGGSDFYTRSDDSQEAVRNRIDVYRDQSAPLVGFYIRGGEHVAVDGVGSPDEVFDRVLRALEL